MDGIGLVPPIDDNSVLQYDTAASEWQNSAAQHLSTTSTPQFLRLGVGVAADSNDVLTVAARASGGVQARFMNDTDNGLTINQTPGAAGWSALGNGVELDATNLFVAKNTSASWITLGADGHVLVYAASGLTIGNQINPSAVYARLRCTPAGSVVMGTPGALATTATDGFPYISTCPGTPTGVPTTHTGKAALIYDSTNDVLYVYDGGWQAVHKPVLTTKGDLLTYGTAPSRLAIGNDGEVLTAQADGTAAWEALPASGAMQRIDTKSGAAASYSFTDIPGTYQSLRLVLDARGDDAAATVNLRVKCNNDSSALYDYVVHVQNGTNFSFSASAVSQTYFDLGNLPAGGSAAGASGLLDMFFSNYAGSTFHKNCHTNFGAVRSTTAGDNIRIHGEMRYRSTTPITRLDITLAAGSFAAGSVCTLYGIS